MWRHNFVNGDLCLKTGQKNNITETTALNIYSWGRHLCLTAVKGNTTCQNLTGENLRIQAHAHKQLTPVLAFKTNTAFHEHTSGCLHKGLKGSAVSFLRKKSFSHTTSLASKSELLRKKKLPTLAVANNTVMFPSQKTSFMSESCHLLPEVYRNQIVSQLLLQKADLLRDATAVEAWESSPCELSSSVNALWSCLKTRVMLMLQIRILSCGGLRRTIAFLPLLRWHTRCEVWHVACLF